MFCYIAVLTIEVSSVTASFCKKKCERKGGKYEKAKAYRESLKSDRHNMNKCNLFWYLIRCPKRSQ